MKLALDRRLAALEAVSRAADYLVLIVIRFIDPGVQAGEATFATALGQRFTREPAETEHDFIDRVHDYAQRGMQGRPATGILQSLTILAMHPRREWNCWTLVQGSRRDHRQRRSLDRHWSDSSTDSNTDRKVLKWRQQARTDLGKHSLPS